MVFPERPEIPAEIEVVLESETLDGVAVTVVNVASVLEVPYSKARDVKCPAFVTDPLRVMLTLVMFVAEEVATDDGGELIEELKMPICLAISKL